MQFMERYKDYAMVPVRLALGWISMAHGGQKLFGWWGGVGLVGFANFLEGYGFRWAFFWAVLLSIIDFVGGFLVLTGIWARWAALCLSFSGFVRIFFIHWKYGFSLSNNGYEYSLALLGLSVTLLLSGPGRWTWRGK